jgi:hypothetical protein
MSRIHSVNGVLVASDALVRGVPEEEDDEEELEEDEEEQEEDEEDEGEGYSE